MAIDTLSALLAGAIRARRASDGRVDSREVSYTVLEQMNKLHPPSQAETLKSRCEDMAMVDSFARSRQPSKRSIRSS